MSFFASCRYQLKLVPYWVLALSTIGISASACKSRSSDSSSVKAGEGPGSWNPCDSVQQQIAANRVAAVMLQLSAANPALASHAAMTAAATSFQMKVSELARQLGLENCDAPEVVELAKRVLAERMAIRSAGGEASVVTSGATAADFSMDKWIQEASAGIVAAELAGNLVEHSNNIRASAGSEQADVRAVQAGYQQALESAANNTGLEMTAEVRATCQAQAKFNKVWLKVLGREASSTWLDPFQEVANQMIADAGNNTAAAETARATIANAAAFFKGLLVAGDDGAARLDEIITGVTSGASSAVVGAAQLVGLAQALAARVAGGEPVESMTASIQEYLTLRNALARTEGAIAATGVVLGARTQAEVETGLAQLRNTAAGATSATLAQANLVTVSTTAAATASANTVVTGAVPRAAALAPGVGTNMVQVLQTQTISVAVPARR